MTDPAPPGPTDADLDPARFATHWYEGRGFRQAYVHEGRGGVPVLLRPRLARDQAHLVAGDRAARRGRVRGDRPRPAGLRRERRPARRLR